MLRLADGRDVDLGPAPELLRAFREMAVLEPRGYEHLYGLPLTNEEQLQADYARSIAVEAANFLGVHATELSAQSRWILTRLSRLELS